MISENLTPCNWVMELALGLHFCNPCLYQCACVYSRWLIWWCTLDFILCINVVSYFIYIGVWKLYPFWWFPSIFWSLKLPKIPNRLPQTKSEIWNFLGMSFTNFKWTPYIEIFRKNQYCAHQHTIFVPNRVISTGHQTPSWNL